MSKVRALNADQDRMVQALDEAREDALAGRLAALALVASVRSDKGAPTVGSSVCLADGARYTDLIGGVEILKAELLSRDSQVRECMQQPPEDDQ